MFARTILRGNSPQGQSHLLRLHCNARGTNRLRAGSTLHTPRAAMPVIVERAPGRRRACLLAHVPFEHRCRRWCGAMRLGARFVLPYAISDTFSTFAMVRIDALLRQLKG